MQYHYQFRFHTVPSFLMIFKQEFQKALQTYGAGIGCAVDVIVYRAVFLSQVVSANFFTEKTKKPLRKRKIGGKGLTFFLVYGIIKSDQQGTGENDYFGYRPGDCNLRFWRN